MSAAGADGTVADRVGTDAHASGERYYFDALDGDDLYSDSEGQQCRDADMAREVALRLVLELAGDNFGSGDGTRRLQVLARRAGNPTELAYTLTLQSH